MIDNSDAEIAGIRAVSGETVPLTYLEEAYYYVGEVVSGISLTSEDVSNRRKLAFGNIKKMMDATTEEEFNEHYLGFQRWCQNGQGTWDSGDLLIYFLSEYLRKNEFYGGGRL
ncbi:unnamed protein product [Absidia cylindrospora]